MKTAMMYGNHFTKPIILLFDQNMNFSGYSIQDISFFKVDYFLQHFLTPFSKHHSHSTAAAHDPTSYFGCFLKSALMDIDCNQTALLVQWYLVVAAAAACNTFAIVVRKEESE